MGLIYFDTSDDYQPYYWDASAPAWVAFGSGSGGTQTANTVYAGPATGSPATPTFRSLVSADIPNNAANTSGNAATATQLATVPIQCTSGQFATGVTTAGDANCSTPAGGGTIGGSIAADQIPVGSGTNTVAGSSDFQKTAGAFITNTTNSPGCFNIRSGGTNRFSLNCSAGTYFWAVWGNTNTNAGTTTNNGVAFALNNLGVVESASDTAATNITATNPAAGLYRLNIYCVVTTADVARSAAVTLSWTDSAGATSAPVCTGVTTLGAGSRDSTTRTIEIASGTPQIAVTYTAGTTGVLRTNFTLERLK